MMAQVEQAVSAANIKELRAVMSDALVGVGLVRIKLGPRKLKAFSLPGEVIRYFVENAYRRPWGFVYTGSIGLEIPRLRQWLEQGGRELGIFHTAFAGYHIANDPELSRQLMVELEEEFSPHAWASAIRERVERIPSNEASLREMLQNNPEGLGLLCSGWSKPAWDFYRRWLKEPSADLSVPARDARGRLIEKR